MSRDWPVRSRPCSKDESFHPMILGEFTMIARKSQWAKSAFASLASLFGSSRKKQPYRTRLLLEVLEDRCVPTTITPPTFADGVLGSGSLRDGTGQLGAVFWTHGSRIRQNAGEVAARLARILANAATKSAHQGISTIFDDQPRGSKH